MASTDPHQFCIPGQIVPAYYNAGNSGSALTIAWKHGNTQRVTLTGNCTFTFTDGIAGACYRLILVQDGTGSRTASWPAAVKWPGGTAATLTTTATHADLIGFVHDGTDYFACSMADFTPS